MSDCDRFDAFESKKEAYQMGYWQGNRDIMMLMLRLNTFGFPEIQEKTNEINLIFDDWEKNK